MIGARTCNIKISVIACSEKSFRWFREGSHIRPDTPIVDGEVQQEFDQDESLQDQL